MERNEMIPALQLCSSYNLEYSFISWLSEHELLQIVTLEEQAYIPQNQLRDLEQYSRLHNDLQINLEGIEAISHLLQRVQRMQGEIHELRNRLHVYEPVQVTIIDQ